MCSPAALLATRTGARARCLPMQNEMEDQHSETLALVRARFGTLNLRWRFPADSDALQLGPETGSFSVAVALGPRQAAAIRALTGVPASLKMQVYLHGEVLSIHLIGRQVGANEWAGSASPNVHGMLGAAEFAQEVSFAETIRSEMDSVVILLDQDSRIQAFNALAEAYTGCKEEEVIGLQVGALFLPSKEAKASRQNVASFFVAGKTFSVERRVHTRKGQTLFHFRHRFVRSDQDPMQRLLVCVGVDLTHALRKPQWR